MSEIFENHKHYFGKEMFEVSDIEDKGLQVFCNENEGVSIDELKTMVEEARSRDKEDTD